MIFQSPIGNWKSAMNLSLPLFVFRVDANHPHHALAMNDLALVAHFFY
jgi:hypothetical protein